MLVDSTAAMAMADRAGIKDRTRHIAMRFHFIRTLIESGVIETCKVDGKENPADVLTKNVDIELFKKHSAIVTKTAFFGN